MEINGAKKLISENDIINLNNVKGRIGKSAADIEMSAFKLN